MIDLVMASGLALDITPDQEVSFTIKNALFSTDHVDTPWSTDFELPLTPNNCKAFKFVPAMLLPPQITAIQVLCYMNGIPVMPGKVEIVSYSLISIKVSFSSRDFNDYLSGYLNKLPLKSWNFGKMTDLSEFREFTQNAVHGKIPEFEAPLLLRSDKVDYFNDFKYIIPGPNALEGATPERLAGIREYWNNRYANFINHIQSYTSTNKNDPWETTGTVYLIPVVRLSYLFSVIAELNIASDDYNEYISRIGILAPNKKNALIDDIYHGGLDQDENGDYVLSLADALPKIKISTFIKDIINLLASTVYLDNGIITILANRDIINDPESIDWTNKVTDNLECDVEDGYVYIYGFQDTDTDNKDIDPAEIVEVKSYDDIFRMWNDDTFDKNKDYIFQIKPTGDIYSVMFDGTIDGHPEFSLLRRGEESTDNNSDAEDDESETTCDAQTNAKRVKCIPATFFLSDYFLWNGMFMAAIVDIPNVGADASQDITLGILQDWQMVDKGFTIRRGVDSIIEETPVVTPLTFSKEDLLYKKYHKPYEEFLVKPKTVHKLELNLSVADLVDLRMWKKVMLYNRLFFIKNLTITLNTSKNNMTTEAEFVQA